MMDQKKIIHWFYFTVDGIEYSGRVRYYDDERQFYTGEWTSATGEQGELGYGLGIGSCSQIERAVEDEVRKQHRERATV